MRNQDSELTAPVELKPRNKPKQKRARKTVERILTATAELLDEEGHENLTTVRVAERSGVNIASLYNYFPNKLALLYAVSERFAAERQKLLDEIFDRYEEDGWRETTCLSIDEYVDYFRKTKGAIQAMRAMQSHPTLRKLDREQDVRISETAAGLLARAGIKASPEKLRTMAMLHAQIATAVTDNAFQWEPENLDSIAEELKLMRVLHISHYIEQSSRNATGAGTKGVADDFDNLGASGNKKEGNED